MRPKFKIASIFSAAILLWATAFSVAALVLYHATGLASLGPPTPWREPLERQAGRFFLEKDENGLARTAYEFMPEVVSATFFPAGEPGFPVVGNTLQRSDLADAVLRRGHWIDEVSPETVTRGIPARDEEGKVVGTFVLKSGAGPGPHARKRPRLQTIWAISTAGAGVVILFLALLQGRRFARRIESFTQAAVDISQGRSSTLQEPNAFFEFSELAEAFNAMSAELEHRLNRLEKAKIEAEIAERKRRDFTADIAHSLGTPLAAAQLGLAKLKQGDRTPEDQQELEALEERLDWLGQATRRLVKLACWETVDPKFQSTPVALIKPIVYTLGLLETKLLQSGVEVELGRFSELKVISDEDVLRTVFNALVENCIQHAGGDCTLKIAAKSVDSGKVEITVEDDGVGMNEETLALAHERYFTRGRTGLGLAIVKRLLDAHDAELQMESCSGKGTLFRFYLPEAKG